MDRGHVCAVLPVVPKFVGLFINPHATVTQLFTFHVALNRIYDSFFLIPVEI